MRFAIDGSVKITGSSQYDVVIIGAGLAGLYTALNIDERYSCCVLAKETIEISNSYLAQGGIAAAISRDDNPDLHYEDTMIAGAGLCDKKAVHVLVDEGPKDVKKLVSLLFHVLVDEGPKDVKKLVSLHVPFDLTRSGDLEITREGGHRKNRIVHAGGDATGREAVKTLAFIASHRANITFHDNTLFTDIITNAEGAVSGVIIRLDNGEHRIISTSNVVIATGGIGQVYKISTNPEVATGDGIAAAVRAGAKLRNIEFIQFHPTGLWSPESENRAFLISEAVRGEGGLLKNKEGVRFMLGAHELNELAPRDIVARAIVKEMKRTGESHVFVDITSKSEEFLVHRFPTIFHECLDRGINISRDWIPVCPVQHYLVGGIETDLNAKTSVKGLYACGEAAYTGVHGANRLASNSMLECLVFGRKAAESINAGLAAENSIVSASAPQMPLRKAADIDLKATRVQIQQLMNDYGYVVRNEKGLAYAIGEVETILRKLESAFEDSKEYVETLNIATIALAILKAALSRRESVGTHYRED